MDNIKRLKEMIQESKNIVFFGGAGVSTESGIPDFRSADGLYNGNFYISPETILSHDFFFKDTESFYKFYRENLIYPDAKPGKAHKALAKLEEEGKLSCVITQNIDCLHEAAGSKNVLKLHGSIDKNVCLKCHKHYSLDSVLKAKAVPYCECSGLIKPKVTLYGESLDTDVLKKSIEYIVNADMLIIGGTSLVVYPAAGLIDYYSGDKIVLINKSVTAADKKANLVIHESIGEVLWEAVQE